MAQVTLRISGNDSVRIGLERIGTALKELAIEDIAEVMEQAKTEASGGYRGGSSYDVSEPPGSTYVRTGEYGRSFTVTREGMSWRLKSDAYHAGQAYTVYVGGDASGGGQASVHSGRWPLIGPTVQRIVGAALTLERKIRDFIRSQGFGGEAGGL